MRRVTRILLAAAVLALPFAVLDSAEAINVAASANGGVASHTATCFSAPASRANDGSTNGNFFAGSVSHTCNGGESPSGSGLFDFWEVDLGGDDHAIDKIIVYNRTDCCDERIDPFRVTLFDGATAVFSQAVAAFVADVIVDPNVRGMTFDLTGQIGDRVRVQLTHQNHLHLAEVEVFDQAIAPPVPFPPTALLVAGGMVALAVLRGRKLLHRR